MRRHLFLQYLQRICSAYVLAAIVFLVGLFIWHLFSKPDKSKIFLDDFSRISFPNDLDCDRVTQNTDNFLEAFPISLIYQTDEMNIGIDTDTEYFSADLDITNHAKIFIRSSKSDLNNDLQKGFYEELPIQQKVKFSIHGKRLWWDYQPRFDDFEYVKNMFPPEFLPPNPDCSLFESGSVYCDELWDEYLNRWVNNEVSFNYEVGICGENLAYVPKYTSATVDDLYSFGVKIKPNGKGLIGLKISFAGVSYVQINGKNRSFADDLEILIFFYNESPEKDLPNFEVKNSSIDFVATGISDRLIRGRDSSTRAMPGLVYIYDQSTSDESAHYDTDHVPVSVRFKGKQLTVEAPRGLIIANAPKEIIPVGTRQLVLNPPIFSLLDFQISTDQRNYIGDGFYKYELEFGRTGALVDGKEFLPSPWEHIPSEIQVAYITVFIPSLIAVIGYAINHRRTIFDFFIWLTTKPRIYVPVTFPPDTYIFRLYSGRKIAGVIASIEGRSTFRVYVLSDAYEWEKDHWSIIVPSEVRIPQNQIEMYYRAQP